MSFVSSLYGDKDNHTYPFFVCKTVGWVDIGNCIVNKANIKRLSILIKKFRL
jgi:hypothetical protein